MGSVTALNGLPSDGLTRFLKNFADKHGTTLVAMGTATLQRAAILGAVAMVAPPLVPLAAVAYGAYKMTNAVSGIYNALQKDAQEKQKNGMGKIASVAAAAKKHKWALLGLAAVGAAFMTGVIDLPFGEDITPDVTPDATTDAATLAGGDTVTEPPADTVVTATEPESSPQTTAETTAETPVETTVTAPEPEVAPVETQPETAVTEPEPDTAAAEESGSVNYAAMPE